MQIGDKLPLPCIKRSGGGFTPPENAYLIGWYKNDEGSGDEVANSAAGGGSGGGLLPDLDIVDKYWNNVTTQTRIPTGDEGVGFDRSTGDYNYANVDEYPSENDSDYNYTSDTVKADRFFFTAFAVPSGKTISDVRLYIRAKAEADQSPGFYGMIVLNNATVWGIEEVLNSSGFVEQYYSWTENPATGLPWTVDQVNGIGTYGLAHFGYGVDASNANEKQVSRIYAEVQYGDTEEFAHFTISKSQHGAVGYAIADNFGTIAFAGGIGIFYMDIAQDADVTPYYVWFASEGDSENDVYIEGAYPGGYAMEWLVRVSGKDALSAQPPAYLNRWKFLFFDGTKAYRVLDDGTIGNANFSGALSSVDVSRLVFGCDGEYLAGWSCNTGKMGDVIIYNNKYPTVSDWAAWYDQLRSRYGMAARNGW